jgi:hypothetical protein
MLDYYNRSATDQVLNWITLESASMSGTVTGEYTIGTFTDETTGYINTGYNPSTDKVNMAADDVSMFGFLIDEFHEQSYNFGCFDGTNGLLFYPKRRNGYYCWSWANTTTYASILNTGTVAGLCGFSQIDGTLDVYTGGTKIGDASVTPAALPNQELYLFRSNVSGSPGAGTLNRIGMFLYGEGLTESEVVTVNSAATSYAASVRSFPAYYTNDYFYYKREALHVDCQRGDYRFATDMSKIYHSVDGGANYKSIAFAAADEIEMSYIFANGDVMFATRDKIYRAGVAFGSYSEVTVKDTDDSPYTPHTPADADYPGNYFRQLDAITPCTIDGTEVAVWGNYGNLGDGANPVNVYYTKDNGVTIKVAYTFGQNPTYRDDGTYDGGATGTLLGDATNDSICRHVHSIACDEENSTFYVTTGDFDRTSKYECHWLKGVYNLSEDSWVWSFVVSASNATRYKSGGMHFVDGYIYFVSDATDGGAPELGVFKCLPADITNTENHTRLYAASEVLTVMQIDGNNMIAANAGTADNAVYVSSDLGSNWNKVTLSNISGGLRFSRIHKPNSDGWFRMDIDAANYYDSYPVYIKFK